MAAHVERDPRYVDHAHKVAVPTLFAVAVVLLLLVALLAAYAFIGS